MVFLIKICFTSLLLFVFKNYQFGLQYSYVISFFFTLLNNSRDFSWNHKIRLSITSRMEQRIK